MYECLHACRQGRREVGSWVEIARCVSSLGIPGTGDLCMPQILVDLSPAEHQAVLFLGFLSCCLADGFMQRRLEACRVCGVQGSGSQQQRKARDPTLNQNPAPNLAASGRGGGGGGGEGGGGRGGVEIDAYAVMLLPIWSFMGVRCATYNVGLNPLHSTLVQAWFRAWGFKASNAESTLNSPRSAPAWGTATRAA